MQITQATYGFLEQHPKENFKSLNRETVMALYGLTPLQYYICSLYFIHGFVFPTITREVRGAGFKDFV